MMTRLVSRAAGWGPTSILAFAAIFLFVVPVLAVVGVPLAMAYTVRGHGPRPIRRLLRRFRKTREV